MKAFSESVTVTWEGAGSPAHLYLGLGSCACGQRTDISWERVVVSRREAAAGLTCPQCRREFAADEAERIKLDQ